MTTTSIRQTFTISILAGLLALPASAVVRRTIFVDGEVDDWRTVMLSPANRIHDPLYTYGDPDLPAGPALDLRSFALTWDDDDLFLYFSRSAVDAGESSTTFLAYFDLNHDDQLGTGDRILAARIHTAFAPEAVLVEYLPIGSDPMTGDGVNPAGAGGADVAGDIDVAVESSRQSVEVRIRWSSLGLSPGAPLQVHAALAKLPLGGTLQERVTQLPVGIVDNADPLDTGRVALVLTYGIGKGAASPGIVDFGHHARTSGNLSQTIDFSLLANRDLRIELWTDPDVDGDPADGELLAVDDNGDGDFLDASDELSPGSDSNADLLPDTGVLAPGEGLGLVVRVHIPSALSGGVDVAVTARSDRDPSVFQSATDEVSIGRVTLTPNWSLRASPGMFAYYLHVVCNNDLVDDDFDLFANSIQGWPTLFFHNDKEVESVRLDTGQCEYLWMVVEVPATESAGASDLLTVRVVARSDPARSDLLFDFLTLDQPVELTPDGVRTALAGTSVYFPHRIANNTDFGTGFSLDAISSLGSGVEFWTDPNGDGLPIDGRLISTTDYVWPLGYSLPPIGTSEYNIVAEVKLARTLLPGAEEVTVTTATTTDDTRPTYDGSATDRTEIRLVGTYLDRPPAYAATEFVRCAEVHAVAAVLPTGTYRFKWIDSFGDLMAIGPATPPDASGAVLGELLLTLTDPDGLWSVLLERWDGSAWSLADPSAVAEFRVRSDLRPTGGVIASLRTDRASYPIVGGLLSLNSVAENTSSYRYQSSAIEYTVFLDQDGDDRPTIGESYMQLDGSRGIWLDGRRTCRATGLPDVMTGSSHSDSMSCRDIGMNFETAGGWTVLARWMTNCDDLIAERTASFNVGCTATTAADAGEDRLLCGGTATPLGSPPQPNVSYSWSPAEFLDDPSSAQPLASPPSLRTYTLTARDAAGCLSTDDVEVVVTSAPVVDAGTSVVICAGDSAVLGSPGIVGNTYSWSPVAGLDDPSTAEPVAAPTETTSYTLMVTEPGTSCSATDLVTVAVIDIPVADAGADGTGPVRIGPAACDAGNVYTWSPPDGLDDPSRCDPVATPDVETEYCLTVRNTAAGCTGASDCVTVTPAPPCTSAPAVVTELMLRRALTDVELSWTEALNADGGYRVYRAADVGALGLPPVAADLIATTAAEPTATSAVDVSVADGPWFYRVVGVCADGVTEGP